jgi:uncharacterized membrane protein YbhN (UPF0104 family)
MNRWLKWLLRIVFSAAALYLIFTKISWQATWSTLARAHVLWLVPAFLLFNCSQLVSATRLLSFYHVIPVRISWLGNAALYYKAMFYNLFLPGGIGGDGYKVYYLHKYYHAPIKNLITATLLDRLNGLAMLGLFIVLLAVGVLGNGELHFPAWWLVVGYGVILLVASWLLQRLLPAFFPVAGRAALYSALVQGLQLTAVIFILQSLHVDVHWAAYLLLFLASSVAAVIPFTIGGAGARELVFVAGAPLLGIQAEQAVAVSLVFFLITVVSAIPGLAAGRRRKREHALHSSAPF